MGETRIRLLGEIVVAGADVRSSRSHRLRTILALLAVRAGRTVPKDDLIEEAWQDELPRSPASALHVCVTRIRAWVGTRELGSEAGGYRLDVEPANVDLLAFLAAADRALESEDPAHRDEAVALWDEPVLPGLYSPRLTEVRALAEARRRELA